MPCHMNYNIISRMQETVNAMNCIIIGLVAIYLEIVHYGLYIYIYTHTYIYIYQIVMNIYIYIYIYHVYIFVHSFRILIEVLCDYSFSMYMCEWMPSLKKFLPKVFGVCWNCIVGQVDIFILWAEGRKFSFSIFISYALPNCALNIKIYLML